MTASACRKASTPSKDGGMGFKVMRAWRRKSAPSSTFSSDPPGPHLPPVAAAGAGRQRQTGLTSACQHFAAIDSRRMRGRMSESISAEISAAPVAMAVLAGVALIAWGELTPAPPQLSRPARLGQGRSFHRLFRPGAAGDPGLGLRPPAGLGDPGRDRCWAARWKSCRPLPAAMPNVLDFLANNLGALAGPWRGGCFCSVPGRALVADAAAD